MAHVYAERWINAGWRDAQFGTKPWLMFGGIVLGFAGAFVLVKRQIAGGTRRKAAQR